ncbi:transmembrane anchor protein [Achromobacter aegrifaciens]
MYNTDIPTRAELPSTAKLLRSTAVAVGVAAVLLVTAVLPGEYGIDPTGVGKVLGLTSMGDIKVQLEKEATADAQAGKASGQGAAATSAAPLPLPVPQASAPPPQTTANATPPPMPAPKPVTESSHRAAVSGSNDETTLTLRPGQGAEIKLDMKQGAKVTYTWRTQGGPVNFDTHGDPVNPPKDFYHGYGKGRQVTKDSGEIEAAFDGKHGWFWRNRSKQDVTITLQTTGDYQDLKRVL